MSDNHDGQKDTGKLRGLLREFLALDPNAGPVGISNLQSKVRAALEETDGRKTRAGFTSPDVRANAASARNAWREEFERDVVPILRELKGQGLTYGRMAEILNGRGVKAPMGGPWAPGSVKFQVDKLG